MKKNLNRRYVCRINSFSSWYNIAKRFFVENRQGLQRTRYVFIIYCKQKVEKYKTKK